MTTSVSALCSDFYINQKIALKMDLPTSRETVLDMFDRFRKDVPTMDRFRRFEDELALESPERDSQYSWFSLAAPGGTAIRSGWVNPESLEDAYRLHRLILDIAPYYLTISPIDVEYIELIFGFDIEAEANRNEIVFDALAAGGEGHGALASLIDSDHERVLDYQPFIGLTLNQSCNLQAFIEVKTRTRAAEIAGEHYDNVPISVYLTVRRYGPFRTLEDLTTSFGTLAGHAERFTEERIVPNVLVPIREAILSRPM
jgi:hypothetical protein